MSEVVLKAELRKATGKMAKTVRRKGAIPGVFYAHGEENFVIEVPGPGLDPLIRTSETHIVDLQLEDGTSKKCILRDVQYDPVTDKPIHFDLQGLQENEELTVDIPIVLVGGPAKGVRDGGMVQHMIHRLQVSCLPKDIPGKIEINIGELDINDYVHVRDLSVPNATILENLDSAVVGVAPPTLVKEEEAAVPAEEAPLEPEVVGKGKKTEEGEEGESESEEKK